MDPSERARTASPSSRSNGAPWWSAGGWRRWVRRWILRLAGITLALLFVLLAGTWFQVRWTFRGLRLPEPACVYSAPLVLTPGLPFTPAALETELRSRGYRAVDRRPARPGEYRRRGSAVDVYLRDFAYPEERVRGFPAHLELAAGRVSALTLLPDGEGLEMLMLEPMRLGRIYGARREARTLVDLDELPPSLLAAVVEVEDQRFYQHPGVDLRGMLRALLRNVRAGDVVEGGSTITQQVVKNVLLSPERTVARKLRELALAPLLEASAPKDEILRVYLNQIYLGQKGSVSIAGVGEAALFYFGHEARELSLAESALLAGLIRSPGAYNPWTRREAAKQRRDEVLELLHRRGKISEAQYRAALREPLTLTDATGGDLREAAYAMDAVAARLKEQYDERSLQTLGLRVFTTIDSRVQRAAGRALTEGLRALEGSHARLRRRGAGRLQGAVVAMNPRTGAVLALSGGREFARSSFNRALQARRQIGSLIKPFVYVTAFEAARRGDAGGLTPASILMDEPVEVQAGGRTWSPENNDGEFRGPVSVREAFARSINVPAVRASQDVGIEAVAQTATACGFPADLPRVPSLALGSAEATPLQVATAFSTLADGGRRPEPRLIDRVLSRDGLTVAQTPAEPHPEIDRAAAYLTVNLMQEATLTGTAARVGASGWSGEVAGKTGTTNDRRDAWFTGFTPDFLAVVWVGYDDNQPLGLEGSQAAVPIWIDLARSAGVDLGRRFEVPGEIVSVEIDPETGGLATDGCPERRLEVFIIGTEPLEECPLHRRHGFWRRLFGG